MRVAFVYCVQYFGWLSLREVEEAEAIWSWGVEGFGREYGGSPCTLRMKATNFWRMVASWWGVRGCSSQRCSRDGMRMVFARVMRSCVGNG